MYPELDALRNLQEEMARRVILEDRFSKPIKRIGGADLAYRGNEAVASCVVFDYETMSVIEKSAVTSEVSFPYVPGFLAFREAGPIYAAYSRLNLKPDILLLNAHGIAHPRRCGAASHIGILLGRATVGVASTRLCGCWDHEPEKVGEAVPLVHCGESVGHVLKSRTGCRPIFVSPGHMISLDTSLSVVKVCSGTYRLPDPIEVAHWSAIAALGRSCV